MDFQPILFFPACNPIDSGEEYILDSAFTDSNSEFLNLLVNVFPPCIPIDSDVEYLLDYALETQTQGPLRSAPHTYLPVIFTVNDTILSVGM